VKPTPPIDGRAVKYRTVDLSKIPCVRVLTASDFSEEEKQAAGKWMAQAIDAEVTKTLLHLAMTGRTTK